MRKFAYTFALTVALVVGISFPANASSTNETEAHFSWSSVISKAIYGTLAAAPVVVYLSLNNRKEK